jgi:hypothetical protein
MSTELTEVPAAPEVFAEWHSRFAVAESDDGKTFKELKEAWKCGERVARRYLHDANKAGILRTGERIATDLAGKQCRLPVYSFVMPKKKAGRK